MADYLCLLLPFPPSVNGLYPGKVRRFKSKAYKAWLVEAWLTLWKQKPYPSFDCKVKVVYSFGRPDRRTRDAFNYEKAVSDLLVSAEILRDDSLIEEGTVRWDSEVIGVRVEIEAI